MNQRKPRLPVGLTALAALLTMTSGCQIFAFNALLLTPEGYETVKADYPYLQDTTVCVLVRAEMETTFDYPHVQWEVADHVRVAIESNVKGAKVIDPKLVVDFQRRDPSWQKMDPAMIGKRFGAQRVLEIVLTQYTTREPDSPYIHRAHIHAVANVYQVKYPDHEPSYTADVRTMYPPQGTGEWGQSERAIRRAAMEAFAQDIAGKFYERQVKSDAVP